MGAAHADTVIGTAGGYEIGTADVKRLLAGLPEATRKGIKSNQAVLIQAVRAELIRKLILAEAERAQYDKEPAIQSDLARLKEEVILRQWVAHQSQLPKDYPTTADVEKAYQDVSKRSASLGEVRLAQIFISAPDGMEAASLSAAIQKVGDLQRRLASPGADFASLAKANSEHQESAAKGGVLDYELESRLIPEIRAAVKGLQPGKETVVVKTAQGFHLLQLVDRRSAKIPPLSEVRDSLIAELRRVRSEEMEKRYVSEIAAKSPPAINEVELSKLVAEQVK